MGLTSELIKVINKYIDETRWMPVELKPLMKEASVPLVQYISASLANMEIACRRTLTHPEIWKGVGEKKSNKPVQRMKHR